MSNAHDLKGALFENIQRGSVTTHDQGGRVLVKNGEGFSETQTKNRPGCRKGSLKTEGWNQRKHVRGWRVEPEKKGKSGEKSRRG